MSKPSSQIADIEALTGINKLLTVVARLRDPNGGCPWDLKQTHQSLAPYLLEEAYEAVEAITQSDQAPQHLCEELGDVLLQVALHGQIAQNAGSFDFQDIAQGIADKLIRRHPHVFGEITVESAEEVTANWERIKAAEKAQKSKQASASPPYISQDEQATASASTESSILKGVSKAQPALMQAMETSKRAVKVGFEWPNLDSLWACVMSEYDEFREESRKQPVEAEKLEEEMGDILFATVNLARHFKIDPEVALSRAVAKFTRRFQTMETLAQARHQASGEELADTLSRLDFDTWDALWNEAKQHVSNN